MIETDDARLKLLSLELKEKEERVLDLEDENKQLKLELSKVQSISTKAIEELTISLKEAKSHRDFLQSQEFAREKKIAELEQDVAEYSQHLRIAQLRVAKAERDSRRATTEAKGGVTSFNDPSDGSVRHAVGLFCHWLKHLVDGGAERMALSKWRNSVIHRKVEDAVVSVELVRTQGLANENNIRKEMSLMSATIAQLKAKVVKHEGRARLKAAYALRRAHYHHLKRPFFIWCHLQPRLDNQASSATEERAGKGTCSSTASSASQHLRKKMCVWLVQQTESKLKWCAFNQWTTAFYASQMEDAPALGQEDISQHQQQQPEPHQPVVHIGNPTLTSTLKPETVEIGQSEEGELCPPPHVQRTAHVSLTSEDADDTTDAGVDQVEASCDVGQDATNTASATSEPNSIVDKKTRKALKKARHRINTLEREVKVFQHLALEIKLLRERQGDPRGLVLSPSPQPLSPSDQQPLLPAGLGKSYTLLARFLRHGIDGKASVAALHQWHLTTAVADLGRSGSVFDGVATSTGGVGVGPPCNAEQAQSHSVDIPSFARLSPSSRRNTALFLIVRRLSAMDRAVRGKALTVFRKFYLNEKLQQATKSLALDEFRTRLLHRSLTAVDHSIYRRVLNVWRLSSSQLHMHAALAQVDAWSRKAREKQISYMKMVSRDVDKAKSQVGELERGLMVSEEQRAVAESSSQSRGRMVLLVVAVATQIGRSFSQAAAYARWSWWCQQQAKQDWSIQDSQVETVLESFVAEEIHMKRRILSDVDKLWKVKALGQALMRWSVFVKLDGLVVNDVSSVDSADATQSLIASILKQKRRGDGWRRSEAEGSSALSKVVSTLQREIDIRDQQLARLRRERNTQSSLAENERDYRERLLVRLLRQWHLRWIGTGLREWKQNTHVTTEELVQQRVDRLRKMDQTVARKEKEMWQTNEEKSQKQLELLSSVNSKLRSDLRDRENESAARERSLVRAKSQSSAITKASLTKYLLDWHRSTERRTLQLWHRAVYYQMNPRVEDGGSGGGDAPSGGLGGTDGGANNGPGHPSPSVKLLPNLTRLSVMAEAAMQTVTGARVCWLSWRVVTDQLRCHRLSREASVLRDQRDELMEVEMTLSKSVEECVVEKEKYLKHLNETLTETKRSAAVLREKLEMVEKEKEMFESAMRLLERERAGMESEVEKSHQVAEESSKRAATLREEIEGHKKDVDRLTDELKGARSTIQDLQEAQGKAAEALQVSVSSPSLSDMVNELERDNQRFNDKMDRALHEEEESIKQTEMLKSQISDARLEFGLSSPTRQVANPLEDKAKALAHVVRKLQRRNQELEAELTKALSTGTTAAGPAEGPAKSPKKTKEGQKEKKATSRGKSPSGASPDSPASNKSSDSRMSDSQRSVHSFAINDLRVENLETEVELLTKELERSRKSRKEMDLYIVEIEAALTTLHEENANMASENQTQCEEVSTLREDVGKLRNKVESLQEERKVLEKKASKAKAWKSLCQDLRREILELWNVTTDRPISIDDVGDLSLEEDTASHGVGNSAAEGTRSGGGESEVTRRRSNSVREVTDKLESVKRWSTDLEERKAGLESELASLQRKYASLQQNHNATLEECHTAKAQLASDKSDLFQSLRKEVSDYQKAWSDAMHRVSQLEKTNVELRLENEEVGQTIELVKQHMGEVTEATCATLKKESEEKDKLSLLMSQLRMQTLALQKEKEELEDEVDVLREESLLARKDLDAMSTRLDESKAVNEVLHEQLENQSFAASERGLVLGDLSLHEHPDIGAATHKADKLESQLWRLSVFTHRLRDTSTLKLMMLKWRCRHYVRSHRRNKWKREGSRAAQVHAKALEEERLLPSKPEPAELGAEDELVALGNELPSDGGSMLTVQQLNTEEPASPSPASKATTNADVTGKVGERGSPSRALSTAAKLLAPATADGNGHSRGKRDGLRAKIWKRAAKRGQVT